MALRHFRPLACDRGCGRRGWTDWRGPGAAHHGGEALAAAKTPAIHRRGARHLAPDVVRCVTCCCGTAAVVVNMDERRDGELAQADNSAARTAPIVSVRARGLATRGGNARLHRRVASVTPGLVNTHHQPCSSRSQPRGAGRAGCGALFGWLHTLYPIWARFTPEHIAGSALSGLAELALSGCTMSSDQPLLYPNGARLDDTNRGGDRDRPAPALPPAAPCHIGQSPGGLPPTLGRAMRPRSWRIACASIGRLPRPAPRGDLIRVGVAPCSPRSRSVAS